MAGAVVGLIPALCLPNGFSLPKDITTITHRAIGAFCLWVGANGLVKGEIHGIDRRGFLRAFNEPVLWERDPLLFLTYFLVWSAVGIITTAIPVFYFLKAIRDTSGFTSAPLPGEKTLLPTYRKWKDLPENFQAIFVFTIVQVRWVSAKYASTHPTIRFISEIVGWVERSDTHHLHHHTHQPAIHRSLATILRGILISAGDELSAQFHSRRQLLFYR